MTEKTETKRMNYKDFVQKAIAKAGEKKYRDKETGEMVHPKGMHSTFSGFVGAFKEYYGTDTDVREVCAKLEADGVIVTRPAFKGVMIYLPENAPARKDSNGSAFLKSILS